MKIRMGVDSATYNASQKKSNLHIGTASAPGFAI